MREIYKMDCKTPFGSFLSALAIFTIFSPWLAQAMVDINKVPPYVKQCFEGDPKLIQCFETAFHHLRPYLATGISEIELPSVEPFFMDELSLSLTTGPNGYRVSLKDIDIFGASNYTVSKLKLSENGKPFESRIHIPLLRINSRYTSSGVLIILPASGNGTFNAQLEDMNAVVRGMVSVSEKNNLKFLHVDTLNLDLTVKNIRMVVRNIYKNNRILTEAINLFLRENGQEVFKVMKPQLRKKLATLFMGIANKLLTHLPVDVFYVPLSKQQAPGTN